MAKVITIQQPLAWGVVKGFKDVENRGWSTDYRGLLWIHAGKSHDNTNGTTPADWEEFPGLPDWKELPYGYIVGCVDLENCFTVRMAKKNPSLTTLVGLGASC